jgi:hypothetical protein
VNRCGLRESAGEGFPEYGIVERFRTMSRFVQVIEEYGESEFHGFFDCGTVERGMLVIGIIDSANARSAMVLPPASGVGMWACVVDGSQKGIRALPDGYTERLQAHVAQILTDQEGRRKQYPAKRQAEWARQGLI